MMKNKSFIFRVMSGLLLCSMSVQAGTHSPLQLDSKIKSVIETSSDPREQYQTIAEWLREQSMNVEFVVGNSNPRFVGIDPLLWSKTYDWDFFSRTQAFGRYFCKGQPSDQVKNPTIVVRADEPGDTLVHEYLHHLQSLRDPSVCNLYERMSKGENREDILKNEILEYEVVRYLMENVKFASVEVKLGNLEKLIKYTKSIPYEELKKIDDLYGWKKLDAKSLAIEMSTLFEAAVNKQKNLNSNSNARGVDKKDVPKSAKVGQFSLLKPYGFTMNQLPICLKLSDEIKPAHGKSIQMAVEHWNQTGERVLGKAVFMLECSQDQKANILVDNVGGKIADGILKYGEVEFSKDGFVIQVKSKEWVQYRWMVSAMKRQAILNQPSELRAELEKKLSNFVDKQAITMQLNFWLHELGHVLGLGHNFAVKSVMNYSQETTPTAYDQDALACVFKNKKDCHPVKGQLAVYPVQLSPENQTGDDF